MRKMLLLFLVPFALYAAQETVVTTTATQTLTNKTIDAASNTLSNVEALTISNGTSPTVNAAGEIAIDTNGASGAAQSLLTYYDGTSQMYVLALDTIPGAFASNELLYMNTSGQLGLSAISTLGIMTKTTYDTTLNSIVDKAESLRSGTSITWVGTPPANVSEAFIDTDGDGASITTPTLALATGASPAQVYLFGPTAYPTADQQVQVYSSSGNAVAWSFPEPTRYIHIEAADMVARTTSGAAAGSTESGTNKNMTISLDFDKDADEFAQFNAHLQNWDGGTVKTKFTWASTGSGEVLWAIQAVALADSDPIEATFGTAVTYLDAVTTASDVQISSATSAMTVAGSPAAGQRVQFQVYRDADDPTDDLNADAKLIAVDIEYTYAPPTAW